MAVAPATQTLSPIGHVGTDGQATSWQLNMDSSRMMLSAANSPQDTKTNGMKKQHLANDSFHLGQISSVGNSKVMKPHHLKAGGSAKHSQTKRPAKGPLDDLNHWGL